MAEKNKYIIELLEQKYGINVSKYDDSFLNKSIQKRIVETFCITNDEYVKYLEQNNNEGQILLDSLQIAYSEFFRNPLTVAALERIVLPSLIMKKENDKRKEIRIWSAACAAGQEVYSMAIICEELKIGSNEKFTYRIFATDQNEMKLNEARRGSYPISAVNNVSIKRFNKGFTKQGESYSINQNLKDHIEFSVFDLFNEKLSSPPNSIFGNFDIVVCANLLFYYKEEFRKIILQKTGNSLANGGYLITGEAEREIVLRDNYHEVFPQSGIFQIK